MSAQSTNNWPAFLLFIVWFMVAKHTPPLFADDAFTNTLLLLFIGWLGIRFAGRALFRRGLPVWRLLSELGFWFALFLVLFPATPVQKVLILWGFGIPLVLAGAAVRVIYERLPGLRAHLERVPGVLVVLVLLGGLATSPGFPGYDYWKMLLAGVGIGAMAVVPLYYGWRFAEPSPLDGRDARFGTDETFRKAGMSDEL